jgi:hypothetical protein
VKTHLAPVSVPKAGPADTVPGETTPAETAQDDGSLPTLVGHVAEYERGSTGEQTQGAGAVAMLALALFDQLRELHQGALGFLYLLLIALQHDVVAAGNDADVQL